LAGAFGLVMPSGERSAHAEWCALPECIGASAICCGGEGQETTVLFNTSSGPRTLGLTTAAHIRCLLCAANSGQATNRR
jgi:hypothetical protein